MRILLTDFCLPGLGEEMIFFFNRGVREGVVKERTAGEDREPDRRLTLPALTLRGGHPGPALFS